MDKVPEGRRAFGKLRYAFTRRSSSIFLSSSAVVAACGVRVAADIADGGGLGLGFVALPIQGLLAEDDPARPCRFSYDPDTRARHPGPLRRVTSAHPVEDRGDLCVAPSRRVRRSISHEASARGARSTHS